MDHSLNNQLVQSQKDKELNPDMRLITLNSIQTINLQNLPNAFQIKNKN